MRLETFIEKTGISVIKFADTANIGSRALVYDYMKAKKTPSRKNMFKIFKATNGAVTPNDFYDFSSKPEEKLMA